MSWKKCLGDWITPSAPTRKKSVECVPDPGLVARKQTLLEKQITGKSEVTALAADAGERLNSWNREYKEALGVRSIEQFQSEYFYKLPSNKRKYNSERCQIAKDNMINAMVEYKTEHDLVQLQSGWFS